MFNRKVLTSRGLGSTVARAFDTTRKRAQQRTRVSSKRDGGISSYAGILGGITGARERGKK